MLSHANEFLDALQINAARFGVRLEPDAIARLCEYYGQVETWNARLHLVAPCGPAQFATRHVLESLLAAPYFPANARVADLGSGAGLPIIPCLIVRPDLQRAILIEASAKKTIFLRETLQRVLPHSGASVINQRFELTEPPEVDVVTCRALDRFNEKFQELIEWSSGAGTLLFFGGPTLREQIEAAGLSSSSILLPDSERRYLFIIQRAG